MIRIVLPPGGRAVDYISYGRSFIEAAYRCASNVRCLQCDEPILMSAPICVNASFACELILKGLILLDGKNIPKKHLLFDLYYRLSDKYKFYLYGLYLQKGDSEDEVKLNFENRLKVYSDEFHHARYAAERAERTSYDVTNLLSLANNMLSSAEVALHIFQEENGNLQ